MQLTIHKYADSRAVIHVSYTSFVFLSFQVAWIFSLPATKEQHEIWLDAVEIMEHYQENLSLLHKGDFFNLHAIVLCLPERQTIGQDH